MAKNTHAFPLLGTQVYPLMQHYESLGSTLAENLDEALGWIAAAGLNCVEGIAGSEAELKAFAAAAGKHALATPSVYLNARLHEAETWRAKADDVVTLGKAAKSLLSISILTLNPEPVKWGSPEDKDDAQLRIQAGALRYLHDVLANHGITLACHAHDPEMRASAREFHHNLLATADKPMKWCLDTHWIYRGCGNSNVALEDIIKLYGTRTACVHLRQSIGGVWSEVFGAGDVESRSWLTLLRALRFTGPIYLEQARESGTVLTESLPERLTKSAANLRELLGSA